MAASTYTATPHQASLRISTISGDANATGEISNLAVLDIDAKHPSAHEWWAAHREQLPATWTVRTRSGGLHLWFLHAPGLRCSAGMIADGIDVRAEGGYVIAWQCVGLPVLKPVPLAPWPDWLKPPAPKRIHSIVGTQRIPDNKQASGLVRFAALAPEGERNDRLFWAACRMAEMVASGLLAPGQAEALLVCAATYAGLSEDEAIRTTRSAMATAGLV